MLFDFFIFSLIYTNKNKAKNIIVYMHVITYDLSVGGSGKNWRGDTSNTRKKEVKVFFSLLSYFPNRNKYDNIIKSMDVYMLIIVCSFNDRMIGRFYL